MLQQTQVSAVRDAFEKWMRNFPTVKVLAEADEESVLLHWQGLGYYSRAKNIHKTAKKIWASGGKFPTTRKELEALPGIGAYTAGAILGFAFHKPEPILDGNLIRIFSRIHEWNFLPTDGVAEKNKYWEEALFWAKIRDAFLTNEALMELGRTVCKKTGPLCKSCPLGKICRANADARQTEFPPRKKIEYSTWTGFALVLFDPNGNVMLRASADAPFLKNHFGFPLFESADTTRTAFPGKAESLVPFENVKRFRFMGTVNHSITRYKIACRVLCAEVEKRDRIDGEWFPRESIEKRLVSSLMRKILVLTHDF